MDEAVKRLHTPVPAVEVRFLGARADFPPGLGLGLKKNRCALPGVTAHQFCFSVLESCRLCTAVEMGGPGQMPPPSPPAPRVALPGSLWLGVFLQQDTVLISLWSGRGEPISANGFGTGEVAERSWKEAFQISRASRVCVTPGVGCGPHRGWVGLSAFMQRRCSLPRNGQSGCLLLPEVAQVAQE